MTKKPDSAKPIAVQALWLLAFPVVGTLMMISGNPHLFSFGIVLPFFGLLISGLWNGRRVMKEYEALTGTGRGGAYLKAFFVGCLAYMAVCFGGCSVVTSLLNAFH